MILLKKIKRVIERPERFLIGLQIRWAHITANQELLMKALYYLHMNKKLNLENPQTFTEKLQWLKLNDHNPVYHKMVDKYEVKEFVSNTIGKQYIIPTIGVWDSFDQIDFDTLPNQFVLKTTSGGGNSGVVICTDKQCFNKASAKEKLEKSMANDIYKNMGEWAYKDVPKRIIAEKYITPDNNLESGDLPDYKFFCFNGTPKFFFIASDRNNKEQNMPIFDFYDIKGDLLPFNNKGYRRSYKQHVDIEQLDEMLSIAARLSQGIPFLRVDLYLVNGKVYFGETTFYHDSGFYAFEPDIYDYEIGKLLQLPIGGGQIE